MFNLTKKIFNNPLIEAKLIENKHLIFIKYTSEIYYKYTLELLETLCKKSKYENKKLLFHTSLIFLLKILYNCGNNPYLNNYDLLILCAFSLGIKSTENQHKSPSLNRLKKIYPEKYATYENEDLKLGEVICIKLLNYNINMLTPYECLFYLLNKNNNLYLLDYCIQELDNLIFQGAQKYVFKRPIDIARESIEKAKFKEKQIKSINTMSEKKQYNNSKSHFNCKNIGRLNLKIKKSLPNNESISTNASSTANISNFVNNCEKNLYYSFKSKSLIKNHLKDINNSRKKTFQNESEEKDKKLKINVIFSNLDNNNINYNVFASPDRKKYNNTGNNYFENKNKKGNKVIYVKNNNKKKNYDSLNKIEKIIDYENKGKINIMQYKKKDNYNNYNYTNSSSPNVFRKPIKVYKKDMKYEYSINGQKYRIKHGAGSGSGSEKHKILINHKMKNNIISNRMNTNYKANNNINFNYEKLNELCHKMNFDAFNNKNEINI